VPVNIVKKIRGNRGYFRHNVFSGQAVSFHIS
jgi:hypothetical protein